MLGTAVGLLIAFPATGDAEVRIAINPASSSSELENRVPGECARTLRRERARVDR